MNPWLVGWLIVHVAMQVFGLVHIARHRDSMETRLKVKWVLRSFSCSNARQLSRLALRMENAEQVSRFMEGALDDMGLGRLVRPGR